jgi:hypothetical protein
VEKSVLRDLYSQGEVSEDTLRDLTGAVDLRLHELDDERALSLSATPPSPAPPLGDPPPVPH